MSKRISNLSLRIFAALIVLLIVSGFFLYRSLQAKATASKEKIHTVHQTDSVKAKTKTKKIYRPKWANLQSEDSPKHPDEAFITSKDYVPLVRTHQSGKNSASKLRKGQTIDLNTADTILLQRVPGIGSSFAKRIAKYRELLGGYYTVLQLQEVYGMDRERFLQIRPYFHIQTTQFILNIDSLKGKKVPYHPYLNTQQRWALQKLLRNASTIITWQKLYETGEFDKVDSIRLSHYLHLTQTKENSSH